MRRAKEHILECFTSSKLCNLIVKQHGAALVRADSRERPTTFVRRYVSQEEIDSRRKAVIEFDYTIKELKK